MNNKTLSDFALTRSRTLTQIGKKFIRPISMKNIHVEMKAASDYAVASNDNHETFLEMERRFR